MQSICILLEKYEVKKDEFFISDVNLAYFIWQLSNLILCNAFRVFSLLKINRSNKDSEVILEIDESSMF